MAMYVHAVHVTKLIQTISTFFSRRWTKTRPTVGQKLSKEAGRSRASAPSRQVCIPTCPGRPKSHQFESNSARPWVSSMSSTRTGWYAICPKTSTECRWSVMTTTRIFLCDANDSVPLRWFTSRMFCRTNLDQLTSQHWKTKSKWPVLAPQERPPDVRLVRSFFWFPLLWISQLPSASHSRLWSHLSMRQAQKNDVDGISHAPHRHRIRHRPCNPDMFQTNSATLVWFKRPAWDRYWANWVGMQCTSEQWEEYFAALWRPQITNHNVAPYSH